MTAIVTNTFRLVGSTLAVNSARREMLNDREHLVVPITMIVPGVLAGNKGPIYYPPEEVARDPLKWNHMPIVRNHPIVNGQYVSARHPELLNKYGMGVILNSHLSGGKLKSQGWFDVARTKAIDENLFTALENGTTVEVSTGLFLDEVPIQNEAVANGKKYSKVARNFRPDHLAILTDGPGACSILDGCGLNVNKGASMLPIAERFRKWLGDAKEFFANDGMNNGITPPEPALTDNELSHNQLRYQLAEVLRASYNQNEPSCYITDVYDDYFVYEMGPDLYRVGYTKNDTGVTLVGNPTKVVRQVSYSPTSNADPNHPLTETTAGSTATVPEPMKGDSVMPMTAEQKTAVVNEIIGNCSCQKEHALYSEADRVTLNGMDDGRLTGIQETTKRVKEKLTANSGQPQQPTQPQQPPQQPTNPTPQTPPQQPQPTGNAGQAQRMTMDQWQQFAPPEVLEMHRQAQEVTNNKKRELVTNLTKHLDESDSAKEFRENLFKKPLPELESLHANLAPIVNRQVAPQPTYYGQAPVATTPAIISNRLTANRGGVVAGSKPNAKDAPLEVPTVNWDELANQSIAQSSGPNYKAVGASA